MTSKGMDIYWLAVSNMEVRPDWENKTQFFPSSCCVDIAIWMHYMDANWMYGEKAWRQLHKNAVRNIEQVLESAPHKAAAVWPPTTHHGNYPN